MVVAVGYAMVINMMATREVWPFFAIGFAFAAISQLTLIIALGAIGASSTSTFLNKVAEWNFNWFRRPNRRYLEDYSGRGALVAEKSIISSGS